MRLKLTLQLINGLKILPLNYNYPLSAWIYKVIGNADESYADFLHNKGYQAQGKRFKFFTFSSLHFPKFKIEGDRISVLSDTISLIISFYIDKAAEHFVMGLFKDQRFGLGDKISQVDFIVQHVESLPYEIKNTSLEFRTISPLVVSRKNERGNDDYLSPADAGYEELFVNNLIDKYLATGNEYLPTWKNEMISFKLISPDPKSKLTTIKADTKEQTKIKGYLFDFELTAPKPILELSYLAGFGRYNAEGFGCVEVNNSS